MFRRVFGAQKSVSPSLLQPSPYQDDPHFRAEAHPLQYQSSAPPKDQFQDQKAGFSVPRKPVAHITASTRAVDQNGYYEEVKPVLNVSKNRSSSQPRLLSTWWLEIICCVLFIGALAAVVVTVWPYGGRPLPQWPYRLSINTLIAVYMVILKAAMLLVTAEGLSQLKWRWFDQERPLKDLLTYDNASRGPWGSLVLLWRLRGQQLASSCGAFITVAALIIDPFAQQVIDPFECSLPAKEGVATIPRTNSFMQSNKYLSASLSAIPLPFQNSFNAGIFNPGRSISFDCSTGNCTFPASYSTVGYCSECKDITNKLVVQRTHDQPLSYNITLYAGFSASSTNITITASRYISYKADNYLVMETSEGVGEATTDMITSHILANKTSSCQGSCPSLAENIDKCRANWDVLKWGCTSLGLENPQGDMSRDPKIGAVSCSLRPCVRTYKAEADTGRLKEELVSVADEWGHAGIGTIANHSMVYVGCLNAEDKKSLTDAGYKFEGKSWMPYNISIDGTSANLSLTSVTRGRVSPKCVYQVGAINVLSIGYFLSRFMNGTVFPGIRPDDYQGETQLQAIFNEGNITFEFINETWKNMSDAITWYMRQNGDTNLSVPALGEAFQTQTCVHIRWLFLLYPAVLVLLAIIFFTVMIFETRRREISRHDWKSSPLTLLFHGLDRQSMGNGEYASITQANEMARIADQTPVRLIQTDYGWQFSKMGVGR